MKKMIKTVLVTVLLGTSFAYSYDNPDIINKEYRIKEINRYLKKEEQIIHIIENYMFLTGDTTPTKEKLTAFYNLETSFWKGLSKDLVISITNGILEIENGLLEKNSNTVSMAVMELYKQNKKKDINSFIKDNKISIQLNTNVKKLIDFIKTLPDDYVVVNPKINESVDTNKKKLEYDGNGFKISMFNKETNEWVKLGVYDLNDKKGLMVSSPADLVALGNIPESKAYIVNDSTTMEMKNGKNGWEQVSGVSGNVFIGDGTILDAACKIYNYDGGSEITINSNKETFVSGIEKFTRIEEANKNGFWVNKTKTYMIVKDMEDVKYLSFPENSTVQHLFICSPSQDKYFSLKKENINGSSQWSVQTKNLSDLISFTGSLFDKQWFFVDDIKMYFYKQDSIFKSKYKLINNNFSLFEDYVIAAGNRDIFKNTYLENKTYLTTLNDCAFKNNCSGPTSGEFDGAKIGGLYSWSNIEGVLQDSVSSTLIVAYSKEYSFFYESTLRKTFKKVVDNNGKICYQEVNNPENFYMLNGSFLPNTFIINNSVSQTLSLSFPNKEIGCFNNLAGSFKSGMYTNYLGVEKQINALLLNSLYELTSWVAKDETLALVNYGGREILFTYKNNSWLSSEIVLTKGDRTKLYYFENNIKKKFYTTELGTGSFYNNGTYDSLLKLYSWEYEPTAPKQLNGFIDVYSISSIETAYLNLDKIFKDFYINGEKYSKKTFKGLDYSTIECLVNSSNQIIVKNRSAVLNSKYIKNNDILEMPSYTNCKNVVISGDNISVSSLSLLENFNSTNEYEYSGTVLKLIGLNNIITEKDGEKMLIVLGNRNTFNQSYFSDYSDYKIYTIIDDSGLNKFSSLLGQKVLYKWLYFSTNVPRNINGLVDKFEPKNCLELKNYLGVTDISVQKIYNIYGKEMNVTCENGNTIIKLKNLDSSYFTNSQLNNFSSYNFNKENLKWTFYNNSDNELTFSLNIPITYSTFMVRNFNFSEQNIYNNIELKYNESFKTSLYNTQIFTLFKNNLLSTISNLNTKDPSLTNYFSFGLYDSSNKIVDEIGIGTNYTIKTAITDTKTYSNSTVKFLMLFNNKDTTTNEISLNSDSEIILIH